MTTKTYIWIDADRNLSSETAAVTPADVGGSVGGYSVWLETLRGGLCEGVQTVRVNNGRFIFTALPTRGMGIHRAWLGGMELGWRSPVAGPVHPQLVPLAEPSGLGWLSGFDELLCRCGLESNGAPEFHDPAQGGRLRYPLHGRIANLPARRLELAIDGESGEITLTGVVEEVRFLFYRLRLTTTISTRVGEPGFRIHDTIENLSATPAEAQLLYHVNFGPPLLGPGSRVTAPVARLAPRDARAAEGLDQWSTYGPPEPGFAEQVYFMRLAGNDEGRSAVLLADPERGRGVSLHFQLEQLPCFTLWKNTAAEEDGYVTGLEPGVNYPNPRSHEGGRGRVIKLAPGGSASFDLRLAAYDTAEDVAAIDEAITQLTGGRAAEVLQDQGEL